MATGYRLDDYDWETVAANQRFMTSLFRDPVPPARPGVIMHPQPRSDVASRPAPEGLTEFQKNAWNATDGIHRRPVGMDAFVPTIGTGAGTCAMATAFGCKERQASGVYWVEPCIRKPEEIDAVRQPAVTAGKLGWVLAQTRAYREFIDPRIPIRIMDFQSPFTTVEQMLGSEIFFLMPYDHPQRLHALMDVVTDFAIDFFRAQIAAASPNCCPGIWPGIWYPTCAGIQMSDDNLVNVSPEVYDEFVVPYNNRISEAFGGLFLHSCTIREPHLPSIAKIKGLTGVNCDISTSVTVKQLLDTLGDHAVVAPHCYINTNTNFASYREFMDFCLSGWCPGKRLIIHPCSVMYIPATAKEIRFNADEVAAAMAPYCRH